MALKRATATAPAKKKAATKTPTPVPVKSTDNGRTQMQVRLSFDLNDRISIEAARRQVSKNYIVEAILAEYLPMWESQNV